MRKEFFIASILMLLHTIEEATFYFWQSKPIGLPALNIYILGQIVLYTFLTYTFYHLKSKILCGIIGAILLYETVHMFFAWNVRGYAPGLITAIIIVLFAIYYWIKFLTKLNSKTI